MSKWWRLEGLYSSQGPYWVDRSEPGYFNLDCEAPDDWPGNMCGCVRHNPEKFHFGPTPPTDIYWCTSSLNENGGVDLMMEEIKVNHDPFKPKDPDFIIKPNPVSDEDFKSFWMGRGVCPSCKYNNNKPEIQPGGFFKCPTCNWTNTRKRGK